jgi:adiponectin receptor
VEIFLNGLERRLHWLEKYGNLKLDDGINRAYATLDAVRESCSSVSGELIDAGRKRAKQMVEVLDTRYNEALAKKETLEGKAQASMKLMEDFLSDMEARAQAVRDAGLSGVVDEGWRRAETGLKSAKDVVDDGIEHVRQAKEAMKRSIEHAAQRAKEHGLIHYDDLPVPWRVNPHIIRGYRFSENKMDCIRSAFQLSNETVNIWSHAIGLIIILSIAFYFYPTSAHWPLSSKTDIFFAAMFFFAACKCLVCSTMWHTMNSISDQTLMERFACVDYTGISFLVAASIMTTEYTAFYCEPISRWTYILTTAAFGVGGIIVPWAPYFNRADMAWARVAFYVSLAATGFIPVIQLHLTRGIWWVAYFYAPIWKSLLVYFTGAVIYALKVPEIFIPGWFDYFGGSHNIWHFAVLGGILFHYNAMSEMFSGAFERASNDCSIY